MGLLILVGSVGNQHGAILRRRMEFGIVAVSGVAGAAGGLVVSITLAIVLKNYWALYFGTAVGVVIPTVGVWVASGWRPSAPRRVYGLREMLKFGAGITSGNMSSFFSRNMDNILIGWRWGEPSCVQCVFQRFTPGGRHAHRERGLAYDFGKILR